MKKKFLFPIISLLFFIVLASTALAALAAGEKQFQLKGSLEASEAHDVNFPTNHINLTGTGQATHVGRYTYLMQAELHIPTLSATQSATLTAADGSTLFLEGTGQGTFIEDPFVSIVETSTITGGTGRFAGATGNVTIERVINRDTKISSGTISGTIVLP
jgi:hypothetical protein